MLLPILFGLIDRRYKDRKYFGNDANKTVDSNKQKMNILFSKLFIFCLTSSCPQCHETDVLGRCFG